MVEGMLAIGGHMVLTHTCHGCGGVQVTEYDKQFSAYMLFYERADELEPIDQLRQVSHPAADAQSPAPAALAPASAAAEEVAAESASAADSMAPSEAIFSRLVDVSPLRHLPSLPNACTAGLHSCQQHARHECPMSPARC